MAGGETIQDRAAQLDEPVVPAEAILERLQDRAALRGAFVGNPRALEIVLEILHWPGPLENEADRVLHNAAQSLLHHLGVWGDSRLDRRAVVARLLGIPELPARKKSFWKMITRR